MTTSAGATTVVVGVADHSGWANLVSVGRGPGEAPRLIDRRRCELVGEDVPRQPYHEAAGLEAPLAEALVEEVTAAARAGAEAALAALLADLGPDHRVAALALRATAGARPLPASVAAILASHSAMHTAEGELYREALADAAQARGIATTRYRRGVAAGGGGARAATVVAMGRQAGPPWRAEHREAAAAAIETLEALADEQR